MYEIKLIKLIALLEYLTHNENFKAHNDILKSYKRVFKSIADKEEKNYNKNDFDPLQNVYRIYSEAPPNDPMLGKYLMERMQELYELQIKILEN